VTPVDRGKSPQLYELLEQSKQPRKMRKQELSKLGLLFELEQHKPELKFSPEQSQQERIPHRWLIVWCKKIRLI